MEIEIIENNKQSLFVYKNGELLFYSTIKFNFLRKNIIKIFDSNDELVLELKSYQTPFSSAKFEILFQNKDKTNDINEITEVYLTFDHNQTIRRIGENHFSFNLKSSYFINKIKIADIKLKFWTSTQKMSLNLNLEYEEFLDSIIFHILSTRTGYNSNSV
ncbi:hypothetical protein ACQ9BO_16265 [Flavobacterium sp. P21]|uniref:hypothetical protein n=1 Tax=Flavobacterium sp. P21 TaxID=3423948 RepID=UPI003D6769C7